MKLATMISRRIALAGLTAALLPAHARAGSLTIGGTGSGLGILRLLAEQHARPGGGAPTILPSLGSRGGLLALAAGRIDLAIVTHPVGQDLRALGFVSRRLATTAVALVAHPGVALRAIAGAEAGRMLGGRIAAWPDRTPLRPILRERNESEWVALRNAMPGIAADLEAPRRPGSYIALNAQDNLTAIQALDGAIGVATLGQIAAEDATVAILSVDGVRPAPETAAAGAWRATIDLHLAWRAPAEGPVADFLATLEAPHVAGLLARNAYRLMETPGT